MNTHAKGGLIVLLGGIAVIVGLYFLTSLFQSRQQKFTSDAAAINGRITIGVDNWVGYVPLCSDEMIKRMRGAKWDMRCEDDRADYASRMKRLRDGELQFAVATVDSNILNSAPVDFPGVMIMVIDESEDGDAIVAWGDRVASIDALKGKNGIRIAFTPASPSHHLLKAVSHHFGVPELLPSDERRIETEGSEGALKAFLAKKADVAALWEPDVSRAIGEGAIKLLGTGDMKGLIVDVLLVSRDFSEENPDVTTLLLSTYFSALKKYRENAELLKKEIMQKTGLSDTAVEAMLKGVHWATFTENCEKWFGVSSYNYGMIDTIDATVRILVQSGDFQKNPLPGENPYLLVQSSFLETLYKKGVETFAVGGEKRSETGTGDSLTASFSPLDAKEWNALRKVGTLVMEHIIFQSGSGELTLLEKAKIDEAVKNLRHYPRFRVVVAGHTSTSGDPESNKALSRDRAESVTRYLEVTYGIDLHRLRAIGYGGEKPLPQKQGESMRAYKYRLPRVEMALVSEVY